VHQVGAQPRLYHDARSTNHQAFHDVSITVYILCPLCLNIDNSIVPTLCDEWCLALLSLYVPAPHLMMAEIDSRKCSSVE